MSGRSNLRRVTVAPAALAAAGLSLGGVTGLRASAGGEHHSASGIYALPAADVDGAPRLVAVEWVSTSPGQLAGIPLHLDDALDVWVLHAWIGLDIPSGMLADHNPDVGACEPAPPQQHAPSGGP
jgi:hypothetical protein